MNYNNYISEAAKDYFKLKTETKNPEPILLVKAYAKLEWMILAERHNWNPEYYNNGT